MRIRSNIRWCQPNLGTLWNIVKDEGLTDLITENTSSKAFSINDCSQSLLSRQSVASVSASRVSDLKQHRMR